MKYILLIILIYSPSTFAYDCPSYISHNEQAQAMHYWLQKYSMDREVNDCEVELVYCDNSTGSYDNRSPVGEVMVTNLSGQTGYVQIRFADTKEDFKNTRTIFRKYKSLINYQRWDYVDENENGKVQKWGLQMVRKIKSKETQEDNLYSIELGTYAKNRELNQENGNDSRWVTCKPNN